MLGSCSLPQAGQQAQQQATLLPAVAPHPEASTIPSEPPTSQARKSTGGTTLASAAREQQTASSPTNAGSQAVGETIPPRPAHALHQWPRELQRAHTTLRRSNFEHELRSHPDKAWVTLQSRRFDGQGQPQSCLPTDTSTSRRLGTPGNLLAGPILCGHMPSIWPTFGPRPLQPLRRGTPLDHGQQAWSPAAALPGRFSAGWPSWQRHLSRGNVQNANGVRPFRHLGGL